MAYSIAEALGNFSQFLGQETQRMEAEDQKELVRASTQRISEAFSKVSPLATEEDVRQLMLDTISDAAGLGTLDTSMPLIQGLYSDSVNAIRNYKARKQDELLGDFTRQRQPDISPEADGQTAYNMFQISKAGEKELTIEGEDATYWTKFDEHGNQKPNMRIQIGPGWKQKAETTAQIGAKYQRDATPYRSYAGTTPEGLPISFNARNGQFYVTDDKGNMVPYTDAVVRGSQSQLKYAIESQRLYKETKNSIYQTLNPMAEELVRTLNLQSRTDAQGKEQQSAFERIMAMTQVDFDKAIQSIDEDERRPIQELWNRFQKDPAGVSDKVNYEYAQQQIAGTSSVVDYNDAKKIYGLTDKEFDGYYNAVIADINNVNKVDKNGQPSVMLFLRDKIRAALNKSETEIANWKDEDWASAWHGLNNKTKGSIMNALRNQNAQ